jgi:hypothetical protein
MEAGTGGNWDSTAGVVIEDTTEFIPFIWRPLSRSPVTE